MCHHEQHMCCMKAKPGGEKTSCTSSLAITLDKVLKLNQKTATRGKYDIFRMRCKRNLRLVGNTGTVHDSKSIILLVKKKKIVVRSVQVPTVTPKLLMCVTLHATFPAACFRFLSPSGRLLCALSYSKFCSSNAGHTLYICIHLINTLQLWCKTICFDKQQFKINAAHVKYTKY